MDITHTQPLATLLLVVVGGIFCLVLGRKVKIPAILFLLLFGMTFGPDGFNLIQPGILQKIFTPLISLLVALVLFEGGAELNFSQYREVSSVLKRLMTIGVLVTLGVGALAAYFLAGMTLPQSILFGAIMIVTGPTVILPILQRIRIKPHLHNILKWEAILIDPLGVIVSVVAFEILLIGNVGVAHSLLFFVLRVLLGIFMGILAGFIMHQGLTRKQLLKFESEDFGGLFVLAINLTFYGLSEYILPHSGLVSATAAGIYLGNKPIASKEQVFHFEKQITLFSLSTLFILLSSNIPLASFSGHLKEGFAVLVVMVVIARPLTIFLSTLGEKNMGAMGKLFLASMAPRGIVSASLATLFAFVAVQENNTSLELFLPVSFIVIIGTIVIYSVVPIFIARHPSLTETPRRAVLLVGANPFGQLLAKELQKIDIPVVFLDTNPYFCRQARKNNFEAHHGSGINSAFISSLDLKGIGKMIALTPNHELNVLACQTLAQFIGKNNVYRLWDKSDKWDEVASPEYEPSWGRPLVVALTDKFWDLWELASQGQDPIARDKSIATFFKDKRTGRGWQIKSQILEENLKVNPDKIHAAGIDFPLFARLKNEIHFLVPDADVPKGSKVFFIAT